MFHPHNREKSQEEVMNLRHCAIAFLLGKIIGIIFCLVVTASRPTPQPEDKSHEKQLEKVVTTLELMSKRIERLENEKGKHEKILFFLLEKSGAVKEKVKD
ncbi:MAG: hypothetical protein Q7S10_03060 [bacterium]|nr:hypothetical protein [bacterium]